MIAIGGAVLGSLASGGLIGSVLGYRRDRRKDQGEQTLGTFGSLEKLNDRLTAQVADLQTRLDEERSKRRELEDTVADERRQRRALEEAGELEQHARADLTARIAVLEQHRTGTEEET
jgi:chromosome segregation ATPase